MVQVLALAVHWFCRVVTMLLVVRAVASWFAGDPYSTAGKFYQMMAQLTEPIVAPCRALLSRWNTGVLDLSVLLAFFMIQIVEHAILLLLQMIF